MINDLPLAGVRFESQTSRDQTSNQFSLDLLAPISDAKTLLRKASQCSRLDA